MVAGGAQTPYQKSDLQDQATLVSVTAAGDCHQLLGQLAERCCCCNLPRALRVVGAASLGTSVSIALLGTVGPSGSLPANEYSKNIRSVLKRPYDQLAAECCDLGYQFD